MGRCCFTQSATFSRFLPSSAPPHDASGSGSSGHGICGLRNQTTRFPRVFQLPTRTMIRVLGLCQLLPFHLMRREQCNLAWMKGYLYGQMVRGHGLTAPDMQNSMLLLRKGRELRACAHCSALNTFLILCCLVQNGSL